MYQDSQDTIVALSTPSGSSLYAIIRISGPDALLCAERLFIPTAGWHGQTRLSVLNGETQRSANCNMQPRTYLSLKGNVNLPREQIEIPSTLYIMKAPYSYTKEDVVEIHTFGSPPILDMIIEELISLKPASKACPELVSGGRIRLAQPGEFTKRAFLHGRIDLTQAEAVIGLIRSRTDAELRAAFSHLKGMVFKKVKEIQLDLIGCCAEVEAAIDFSDRDIEFIPVNEITERLNIIYEKLNDFLNHNVTTTAVYSDGVKTVLCGLPNAGKSSLFNALLGRRQAIVTPIPGTTRDVLEGALELGNIHFRLLDTAGIPQSEIRNPKSEIRNPLSLAIAKTHDSLQMGQLILFVLDGSKAVENEDIELFNSFPSLQKIIVINKCDIAGAYCSPRRICLRHDNTPLQEDLKGHPIVETSAVTGEGLNDLKNVMVKTIHDGRIDQSASDVTLNARHKAAFKRTLELIECAKEAAAQARTHELIALDLREALETLGEVVGEATTEDILDKIFSNFCIGK